MGWCNGSYIAEPSRQCIYCGRPIPNSAKAVRLRTSVYACLPCNWWAAHCRDGSYPPEISTGERMENWYVHCPECSDVCNVSFSTDTTCSGVLPCDDTFGEMLEIECDYCDAVHTRPYGYEESEYGGKSEWERA